MITRFYKYMTPIDGDGESSGAAVDFGNDYTPPTEANDTGTAAAAAAEAAAAEAEAAAAEELAKTDVTTAKTDEPLRDESGKFTKKDKAADDGPLIPKSRFDEQLGKERSAREAAERRAAEAEALVSKNAKSLDIQKSIDKVADLRAQERKALIDGDEGKAAALSAEADALNRQIVAAETRQTTQQDLERTKEEIRMDTTIDRLTETYPALRVDDDAYDQDLVDDILDKQAGLIERERLSPSAALAKAAHMIMSRQVKKNPATENTDDEPSAQGLAAGKDAERKAAAVLKNIAAASAQPGNTKDVGLASDKAGQTKTVPNPADMAFDEFAALPEATRAKMRGDFV